MHAIRLLMLAGWVIGCLSGPAGAAGLAELRLDANAVAELLDAALPGPAGIQLPGLGEVNAVLGPVRRAAFVDGGIEADVLLSVERAGFRSDIVLRFLPEIERRSGAARLVLDAARLPGVPFELDLERWVAPAELPRSLRWDLEMPGAPPREVLCYVQSLTVERDRLRIDLGLVGRSPRLSSASGRR